MTPLWLLAVLGVAAAVSADGRAPIHSTAVSRVVSLLQQLHSEIEEEGKKEAELYDKFACFCKDGIMDKQNEAEKGEGRRKDLQATRDEAKTKEETARAAQDAAKEAAEKAQGELDAAKGDMENLEKEMAAKNDECLENARRVKAAADHLRAQKEEMKGQGAKLDFLQSGAQAQLKMLQKTVVQALTVNDVVLPRELQSRVDSFFQASSEQKPPTYVYSSNNIIKMLEDLENTMRESCQTAKNEDIMKMGVVKATISSSRKERDMQKQNYDEAQLAHEQAVALLQKTDADLAELKKDMEADAAFMKDLMKQCEDKAKNYHLRVEDRSNELAAIEEATQFMQNGFKALEGYGANEPVAAGLVQVPVAEHAAASFLQMPESKMRALGVIAHAARKLHSSRLSLLVMRASEMGPFDSVLEMIEDLITSLEKQKTDLETEFKSNADDLAEAEKKVAKYQQEVEKQKALILENQNAIKHNEEMIEERNKLIEDNEQRIKEMTEVRQEENEAFVKAEGELKEGMEMIKGAIAAMQKYDGYKFIQQPALDAAGESVASAGQAAGMDPDALKTFDSADRGRTKAGKGIVAMMTMIHEDLDKNLKKETSDEETAQNTYDKTKKELEDANEQARKEIDECTTKLNEAKTNLANAEDDLKSAEGLLKLANEDKERTLKKIRGGTDTYEERKAAREAEIAALKEALQILRDHGKSE